MISTSTSKGFKTLLLAFGLQAFCTAPAWCDLGTFGSLGEDQAHEKMELDDMRNEMNDIKGITKDAVTQLNKVNTKDAKNNAREFHLICKEGSIEVFPGTKVNCLTYNGHIPGPVIRVHEGDLVRVIVHNQMTMATSLHFHGLVLPQSVDGLPRRDGGLVRPGDTYSYQFVAQPAGTYWYHPQIVHSDQKVRGMYGALIVDSKESAPDEDFVLILGELDTVAESAAKGAETPSKTWTAVTPTKYGNAAGSKRIFYLVNGQSAPAVPPIEVVQGKKVRLRVVNASQTAVPIHLSGHKLEVVNINGEPITTQASRDTVNIGPSDRVDLEFTADNPGVWSLGSELYEQTNNEGKFPGGIALVVRYVDASTR
jgi:manganese oxidase